jgi:hypothetical protein
MTNGRFTAMNDQEQRKLARRLADDSEVFDFEMALRIVQRRPAEAERLIRMGEEGRERQEEFARSSERRKQALQEFR